MKKFAKNMGVLLLVLALLATSLTGCKQKKAAESTPGSNVNRYSLYISGGKLMVADLQENKVRELDIGGSVESDMYLANAVCGDQSPAMVFALGKKDAQNYNYIDNSSMLYYWDGTSDKAELICENGKLTRIGKNMDTVLYQVIGDERKLYLYTPDKGNTLLSENVFAASLSEDGSHIFYQEYVPDKTTPPFADDDPYTLDYPYSVYYMQLCERTADGKVNVLAVLKTFDLNVESMPTIDRVNVAPDHSAAAYRRDESEGEGRNCQAYLWTKETGEQKLPFEALSLYVMGADDIYYLVEKTENEGSEYSLWHYNGETSAEVLENCQTWLFKIADDVILAAKYTGEDEVTSYICRNGKAVQVPMRYNTRTGSGFGFTEYNKTLSGWKGDMLYTVSLEEATFGQVLREIKTVEYSPRYVSVADGHVYYTAEDQQWLDGRKMISGKESDCQSAGKEDVVTYCKDGKTYLYSSGKTALLAEAEEYTSLYVNHNLDDTQLCVYTTKDGLYTCDGSKATKLSEKVPDGAEDDTFLMVTTWDQCDSEGLVLPGVGNGAWYGVGNDMMIYLF